MSIGTIEGLQEYEAVGPDAGLTVNAVHLSVGALGLNQTNMIVASSESDIGNCP